MAGPMTPEGWVAMQPEGIRGCTSHDHPVLLLREVGEGTRRVLLQLDESEAIHLARVFAGVRAPRCRIYETLEDTIVGLGGAVTGLRLLGNRHRGMRGEIELSGEGHLTVVAANPGDVAALAWRLKIEIRLPAEVASRETVPCRPWPLAGPGESSPPAPIGAVLTEADPEDYDW